MPVQYLLTSAAGPALPRRYPRLAEAMAATDYPDPAGWKLTAGYPDKIFAGQDAARSRAARWRIDAPNVAHELVDAVSGQERDGRCWSRADLVIISAVVAYFLTSDSFLPAPQAWQAGARIAGHYAAAGEVTQARITAAVLAAYGGTCLDCSPAVAAIITGQVAGQLRDVGVVVYDDRAARDDLPGIAGPAAGPCRLYRARAGRDGQDPGGPDGEYGSLNQAMAAAGHPGFSDWQVRSGIPDRIFLSGGNHRSADGDPARPGWVIEAPEIARQYAEACPDEVRLRRRWSAASSQILSSIAAAVMVPGTGLRPLPARIAARAATRLDGQHATGGLTATGIIEVLLDTYSRAGLEPSLQAVAGAAARITAHLAGAGIAVAGTWMALPSAARHPVAGFPPAVRCPASAARRGRRPRGTLAAVLDTFFWRLAAPIEGLARRSRRLRRVRAGLRNLVLCWVIPLGIPAAAGIAFDLLPYCWQDWLAIVAAGGIFRPSVPAGRAVPVPGPPWEPR